MPLAFRPEQYAVHTEVYDGPLELLLYLIRRDGIDVRDIPIAHVTREYLSYLDQMVDMDLDLAGEFVLMAAVLCQLKSREILPRAHVDDPEEDELDPRQELARRLLQYQRFKEAAEKLEARPMLGRDVFTRPEREQDPATRAVEPGVDVFGLLEAFYEVLQRAAEEPPTHSIELEQYSMAERVRWVLERLQVRGLTLREVFQSIHARSQRILTFIAVLEMARLQFVSIEQTGHLQPVLLVARVSPEEADMSALPDEEATA